MSDIALTQLGLEALAIGYRMGRFSPHDLLSACLAEVDSRNGALNVIVHLDRAGAQRSARESAARWRNGSPLSPIDGAPIVVKANCAVAGMPWTAALRPFANQLTLLDSFLVSRLRAAGVVIVGIANMHEAALGATTTSPLYGPCMNPRREGYTPGGSSGGSAAAIAASFCIGAIGTDTMGSVRVPSSYCGVVGFKPSAARIACDGVIPLSNTLDHVGLHARSVADLAAFAEVTGIVASGDVAPRIAWLNTNVAIDHGIAAAIDVAMQCLREEGMTIGAYDLRLDLSLLRRRGLLVCEAELAAMLASEGADLSLCSPALQEMLAFAAQQSKAKIDEAYSALAAARQSAIEAFSAFDFLLSPTTPQTAFPHQQEPPANQADLTVLANAAGCPAICLPVADGKGDLPASLQLIAAPRRDGELLSFARKVEQLLAQSA